MIEDLVDRLRWLRTPGIGPVTFRQLIMRFGTPATALDAVPDSAQDFWLLGQGLDPRLLAEIEDAPPLFMSKAISNLLDRQGIGASSGAVRMALLELDLGGRLDRHAGGKVSLRPLDEPNPQSPPYAYA